jgi:small subunit ribosomal protein S9
VTDEKNTENEPAAEVPAVAPDESSTPEVNPEPAQQVEDDVVVGAIEGAVAEVVAEAEVVGEAEEIVAEAVIEEAVAEAVEEAVAEAVIDEAVAEAVIEEAVSEAIVEAVIEEAVAEEYIEETPREKPAIPGADLIPDIVTDGLDFLDAEARAAAEAEAEEAAARAAQDEADGVAEPIAEVAIDLAAGARYTATGKRKTGVARVILRPGAGTYVINGKTLEEFFPRDTLQRMIRQPLEAVGYESRMDVIARMHGGGVSSQAGALRHGISKALLEADPNLRGELKRRGFLTRDPRVKERKKAGLKKARKRPQFSKR